jgi:hypothetical protein
MLVLMVCYTVISLDLAQPSLKRGHEAAAGGDAYTEHVATPTAHWWPMCRRPLMLRRAYSPHHPGFSTHEQKRTYTLTGLPRNAQKCRTSRCARHLCYCWRKGQRPFASCDTSFAGDWYEKAWQRSRNRTMHGCHGLFPGVAATEQ